SPLPRKPALPVRATTSSASTATCSRRASRDDSTVPRAARGRELSLRRGAVRDNGPLPQSELLPLLALSQALGRRRPGAGTRTQRGIPISAGRGADRGLPPRGRNVEGVLPG